jgi:predicted transcriptional regulator
MMAKRPDGALEHDIMKVLWTSKRPLQPGQINDLLETHLAYTSVATVLGRLHAKGWVQRAESGRAYAYRAAVTESALVARRIGDLLASADDRRAVLAEFVGSLSKRDADAVRALLDKPRRG